MRRKEGVGRERTPFLFWKFFALLTGLGWVAAIYPAGGDPSPPTHPDRLHSTGSRAGRARCKADHARQGTHAQTLGTLHRSALDTRQATSCRSYQRQGAGGLAARPKLCRFGHSAAVQKYISFLNTFVARATENPFTVSQKCDIIMSQE